MKKLLYFALAFCTFGSLSCGSKEPQAKATQTADKALSSAKDPDRYVHTKPAVPVFKITNPKTAEEHYTVAVNHDMNKRTDQAIEEYKKAIALKPNWAIAHFRLAMDYRAKQNIDAAIAEWKETTRDDPHFLDAYNALTVAYKEKGDLKTAAEYYEHMLDFPPMRIVVHYRLGFWYKELGERAKARQHLEDYIQLALNSRSKEAGTDRYQKAVRALEDLKAKS